MKTFGLQECNTDGTACTSALGNFLAKPGVAASPAGNENRASNASRQAAEQPADQRR